MCIIGLELITMQWIYNIYNIYKLQHVQNTLARIVTRQHGLPGTTQALATLHWLPVKWRVQFKSTTTYKLLSTGQPSYLASLITAYVLGRSLRSTGAGTLSVPRTKTFIGSRGFRSSTPSVWNRLSADIRNSSSLLTCRDKLKTHFYRLASE